MACKRSGVRISLAPPQVKDPLPVSARHPYPSTRGRLRGKICIGGAGLLLVVGGVSLPVWRTAGPAAGQRKINAARQAGLEAAADLLNHHARSRRSDPRKGITETDCAALLDAARQQLHSPSILVWDNLNVHASDAMTSLIARPPGLEVHGFDAL
jgi:hypothetical protein